MKRQYIQPVCDSWDLSYGERLMLYFSVYDEDTEIIGAKEQDYDFDDWPTDPWEDHIWQEEEKTDIWND
jgi:hypothetical protein